MNGWKSSRRRFLGGTAVCLGLPALDSLVPRANADAIAVPKRLVCIYAPNGMPMQAWHPAADDDTSLSAVLDPLAPMRAHVSVVSGLANEPANIDGAGHHAAGTAGFLTAARARRSEDELEVGVSIDQVFAQRVGASTRHRSFQLGLESGDGYGNCDNGFSCAYSRNISWSDAATPMPKITSPAVAFDLLVGGDDPAASAIERARRKAWRTSVLDTVLGDIHRVRARVGRDDAVKLESYLDSMRELEQRVAKPPLVCEPALAPGDFVPDDVVGRAAAMRDVMVLALRCDCTRSITLMLGNSASDRDVSFLGLTGTHHGLSHHAGDPDKLAALEVVARWELQWLADLLAALADVPEADGGSLLDHTAVLFGSELSEPNSHRHDDLPIVLAGAAGSALHPGRNHRFPDRPLADLHLAILQALDVDLATFGNDGTEALTGL
jgi:hypothetical protein